MQRQLYKTIIQGIEQRAKASRTNRTPHRRFIAYQNEAMIEVDGVDTPLVARMPRRVDHAPHAVDVTGVSATEWGSRVSTLGCPPTRGPRAGQRAWETNI